MASSNSDILNVISVFSKKPNSNKNDQKDALPISDQFKDFSSALWARRAQIYPSENPSAEDQNEKSAAFVKGNSAIYFSNRRYY